MAGGAVTVPMHPDDNRVRLREALVQRNILSGMED
jgi:hypothetical protein